MNRVERLTKRPCWYTLGLGECSESDECRYGSICEMQKLAYIEMALNMTCNYNDQLA